jgi:hypothetical protein
MAISYILWSFGLGISPRFGMLDQEKSGNPGGDNTIKPHRQHVCTHVCDVHMECSPWRRRTWSSPAGCRIGSAC